MLETAGVTVLPNTAGCYTARDAITTAKLAREALETDLIKLEVIGDELEPRYARQRVGSEDHPPGQGRAAGVAAAPRDLGRRHRLRLAGEPNLSATAGGHYILGEKLRQGTENRAALARPGRYQVVDEGLHVKEVWVGEGETRRRFVVARNQDEARRDKLHREAALARLEEELAALERKQGEARTLAEAELLTHPTLKRYLVRRRGRLAIDRGKAREEQHLDGKFLISSSDDELTAAQMAIYYKQLGEVERAWRDQKHILDLRPIYHRKEDRIRAHVLLSFLALLLTRVAETRARDTWPNLRRELERIDLGYFHGTAGRALQLVRSPVGCCQFACEVFPGRDRSRRRCAGHDV